MKPMLAHDYNKRGKSITYPAFVQPKLDGIRVIAHTERLGVKYYSRLGNEFNTLGHLSQRINDMFPQGTYLDGEIYVHGMGFEDICSAVKRDVPNLDSKRMEFWVFDFPSEKQFEMRNELLKTYSSQSMTGPLVFLPAMLVKNEDEMKKAHKIIVQRGYEGTMIRNADAPYVEKRSIHLQKYKNFMDEEFEIIGTKECTGKDAGLIKFICVTKAGVEFDVEPSGSDVSRREMWKNRESYHGKWITVKFQNYTNGGAPRFPSGISIRDYE
jgi:DNA ligase-1